MSISGLLVFRLRTHVEGPLRYGVFVLLLSAKDTMHPTANRSLAEGSLAFAGRK